MRIKILFLALSIFSLLPLKSLAGHSGEAGGNVHNIMVHRTMDIPVLMFSTNPYFDAPTCPESNKPAIQWAVKLDEFGKSVYSLVLSAQAQGKKVKVTGSHQCSDWPDRESIFYIELVD
ncbi:hypothetical protein ACJJIC_17405 [Microbulbifer sp. ANSA002]|uniref:hypothetical protein n=1 Tax=unclassified Microbulbifer TaxID=2619833 RepID=UPI004043336A